MDDALVELCLQAPVEQSVPVRPRLRVQLPDVNSGSFVFIRGADDDNNANNHGSVIAALLLAVA